MNHSAIVTAYLGLGSNLANPVAQLKSARLAIAALDHVEELAFSSFYQSPPLGQLDQPDYVNAVMAITTDLDPLTLLQTLHRIEEQHGRVRNGVRWQSRTLDLDLLLYGEQQHTSSELLIPHPGIKERAFVLYPLQEIAPALVLPTLGAIAELVAQCPQAKLKKLS